MLQSPEPKYSPTAPTNSYIPVKTSAPTMEQATIGRTLVIKGEVSGSEALFIDGRVEVYGAHVFSQYLRVSYLATGWQDVLAQAHPDAIVLPSAHPLTGILGQDPGWTMLSRDEVATVFIRVGFAQ